MDGPIPNTYPPRMVTYCWFKSRLSEIFIGKQASIVATDKLKVLKQGVGPVEAERFRKEAVLAADFSHPNLVRVLEERLCGDGQTRSIGIRNSG